MLTACLGTTEVITVPVREPTFPPSAYVQPCYPERPERVTIESVIESQHAAILQCNAQLSSIRAWMDIQTDIAEDEKKKKMESIKNEN